MPDRAHGDRPMLEHELLRRVAGWLQDIALFCTIVKPALLTITESVLFVVGLVTVLVLTLRAH